MTWGETGLWELGRCGGGLGVEREGPRAGPAPQWAELAEDLYQRRALCAGARRFSAGLPGGRGPVWPRPRVGRAVGPGGRRPVQRGPPEAAKRGAGRRQRQRQRRLGRVHTEWRETGGPERTRGKGRVCGRGRAGCGVSILVIAEAARTRPRGLSDRPHRASQPGEVRLAP